MCFSFEVSIGTFITSWGISLYLLNKKKLNSQQINDIYFLMIFSTMQLTDAILWFIKMKKNIINYIVTSLFIPLILSAQILFNLYYSTSICDNYLTSPIWASNEIKFWEFLMFALLIFYPKLDNLFLLSVIFIFFPLLYIFMDGAYGSLWCAVANIVAFKYLLTY
jgi:hypothetical protein